MGVLGDRPWLYDCQVGVQFEFIDLVAKKLPDVPWEVVMPAEYYEFVMAEENETTEVLKTCVFKDAVKHSNYTTACKQRTITRNTKFCAHKGIRI